LGAASNSQATAPRNGGVTKEAVTSARMVCRPGMSVRDTSQLMGAATTQQIAAEENAMIAVVEATARYKAPARYDDELIVRTTLGGVRGSIVRFRYAVVRAADELLLCEGETVHLVVGRDMKRREMPERYAEQFAALLDRAGSAKGESKE